MEKIGWASRFSENESLDKNLLMDLLHYEVLNIDLKPFEYKSLLGFNDTYYLVFSGGFVLHYIPKYNIIKEVKQWNCHGYKMLGLRGNDGKYYHIFTHRLVALTFIPNPQNKPEVNHIDKNPQNNCVGNLEWVTKSENEQHKWRVGKKQNEITKKKIGDAQRGGKNYRAKKVMCIETGKTWDSASEASRELGNARNYVCRACKEGITVKGLHFKYI